AVPTKNGFQPHSKPLRRLPAGSCFIFCLAPAMRALLEPVQRAELIELRPKRAEAVDRAAAIAVAERHPAEQDLLGRNLQRGADELVHPYPGDLRAGVEPIAPRQ